jgi:hypothetical protein
MGGYFPEKVLPMFPDECVAHAPGRYTRGMFFIASGKMTFSSYGGAVLGRAYPQIRINGPS